MKLVAGARPSAWVLSLALPLLVTGCASSGVPGGSGSGGASNSGSGGSDGVVITGGGGGTGGDTGAGGEAGTTSGTGATGGSSQGGTSGAAGTGGSSPAGTGGIAVVTEPKLVTSAQGAYWKVGTLTEVTSGNADVTVNDASALQTWNGFGGTFNEAGWNALSVLGAADRAAAMKLLFDAADGARFVYGRVPIGASDYATARYTLDENPGDTTMAKFSVDHDKAALIPYIQAALAINAGLHLWASPWTPPTWMKDNAAMDGGHMKEDAADFQALALYLARFVEDYGKLGIKIEAVHPQNEPNYETRYPSCLWTPAGMATFIGSYLGPTFASRNIAADIYLGTMSNADAGKDGTIISTVTGNATAAGFVKGFGLQWNMLPNVAGLKSRNQPIVQTEHKCGNYPWNPAGFPAFNPDRAPNDYPYAVESWGYIRDWIKAGVNVYSAWNMVLDTAGKNLDSQRPWPQNALLIVDTTAKTLIATPAYFVFRHVSQYVDPGAKVVATSGGDALAFKNPDGTIVAVVYNSGAARKMTVGVAGKKEQFDMPANGWATINWK
jgi:glucosylceramidase